MSVQCVLVCAELYHYTVVFDLTAGVSWNIQELLTWRLLVVVLLNGLSIIMFCSPLTWLFAVLITVVIDSN